MAQFETLNYLSCLRLLDTDKSGDRAALSYAFRPLTKNKYVAKHNDSVNILAKGRALFPKVTPLVALGGGGSGIKRVNSVSRIAALFCAEGIEIINSPEATEFENFVPSACWRKIRTSILSTARFAGMLFLENHRLAVYDIGDGNMDWQLRAERSLFYINFNEAAHTHATGMLFICDDDKRVDIAIRIIRETMWRRKQLIEYESYYERERPVKYARSPIRIALYYERVYLTTPDGLRESLKRIRTEGCFIKHLRGENTLCGNKKLGDFEDYPRRYFVNPTTELLKFVNFFAEIKSDMAYCSNIIKHTMILPKSDFPIMDMYPDVIERDGVEFYECKYPKDFG